MNGEDADGGGVMFCYRFAAVVFYLLCCCDVQWC